MGARLLLAIVVFMAGLAGCSSMGVAKLDCSNQTKDVWVAAECRFIATDYAGALQDYQRIAATPATKVQVANKLQPHVETLITKGKLLVARDYLDTGLALARAVNDQRLTASYLMLLGELAYRLGDYDKAKSYMEQAQPLLKQTDQPLFAIRNRNNLGNTLSNLGQFDKAEQALDQALADAIAQNDHAHIAQTLNNQGGLFYNLRRYAKAMIVLEQAEAHAIKAQHTRLQLYAAATKGAVLRQQGDFVKALQEYERALTISKRFPAELQHEIGTSKRVIAELLIYSPENDHTKNLALAEQYLQEALVLHRENPIEMGLALNHLGEISLERHDVPTAIRYFEQGLQNYQALDYPDGVGRSHLNIGRAHNAGGQYPKALQALDKANEIYTRLRDREWLRVGLYERALAYERLGKIDLAERDYKASVDNLESIRGDVHGDQVAQELFTEVNSNVYERLVSLLMEKGDIAGALEYIERSRLRALDEYMLSSRGGDSDSNSAESDTNTKDALTREKIKELREQAAKSLLEGGKGVKTLMDTAAKEFQDRQKDITQKVTLEFATTSVNKASNLPPDTAVITYFPAIKATYAFVSRGGRKPVAYTLANLDQAKLHDYVLSARSYLQHKENTSGKEILASLYTIFISPIEEMIQDNQTLIIYPHDYLTYIPFEALISPDQKYLVESKRVTYAHSINDLYDAFDKNRSGINLQSVAVFANPQPLPAGLKELANAEKEADKIKENLPQSLVKVLKGEQATEQAFKEEWGKHEIIHVAAHGKASPEESVLYLAKGNSQNEDGKLTQDDMPDLGDDSIESSGKVQLVVLSACETAVDSNVTNAPMGESVAKLGLAGMVHQFASTGVPSKIGSLWEVNDASTSVLMGDMYKFIGKQGKMKVPYDAFRDAQLEMIKGGGIPSHPFYWAGFVYFGVPQ
ncbi:CHAT domain-containing protein [Thiothrix caldifontis]|uniref:CHAT domain-containing protein n=1 Tax=Thiothrix caldifontis TaxID=525918 RepID=A0A1H4F3D7_9GAMM|nr:CHAT domain-containing protein [Thiothrix caldifontis]SEA91460.1 CHAT domain-containing protein [Thiothrix caldifontis]